jgi:hypothetical protein
MADHTDPEALAHSIGKRWGVTPVPGFRVESDELVLPIVGRQVSMVSVAVSSYYLRLHFWGMPDFVLEVEGSGWVQPSSSADRISVEPNTGSYVEVTALLGDEVVVAVATREGALHLGFAGGASFEVDAPRGYETWQLRDDASEYIVVTHAGGGIVQFGEPDASVPKWTPVSPGPLSNAKALWRQLRRR